MLLWQELAYFNPEVKLAQARVGVIGLGLMGGGMARTLQRKGYDLTVFDASPAAAERLVRLGAKAAGSPRELAQKVDFVFTVLPDGPQVEEVILGPDGVLAGAHPGTFVADSSTIDPAVSEQVRRSVCGAGYRMIDCSLNRSPKEAEEGTLIFMVGASPEDFAVVHPLLQAMGTDIFHCGGPGAGITMKVINNILTQSLLAADCEALVLGAKAGLDVDLMLKVLTSTNADNGPLHNAVPNQVVAGNYAPGFKAVHALKDMGLAHTLAARLGVPLFTLGPIRQLLSAALGRGKGELTSAVIATVLEELAGVSLVRKKTR